MVGSDQTIGEWTQTDLMKFVQQFLMDSDFFTAAIKTFEELTVTRKLIVEDEQQFLQSQTTVGAAGSASALPATPSGYFKVLDPTGSVVVIPYYKSS